MSRNFAFVLAYAATLIFFTASPVLAAQFGTAEEAKAMLETAVVAVKEDKAKALDIFNKGEGGFKKGYPLGEEMMQKATEGTIREVTYWWPRPGTDTPLEKISYYTKVGDQICGVGYYKG